MVKKNISAKIHVNKKPVLIGEMPWVVELMHDRIEKAIGNGYLTSLSLENLGHFRYVSYTVINDLIKLISTQKIHPEEGLNEIEISSF